MRVLYVNHTAEVSGGERSLLTLLEALGPRVSPLVATPPGQLARELERIGVPTVPITGTAGSLRLHPLHTPVALAQMSAAAVQVHRAARAHRAQVIHANSIRAGVVLAGGRPSRTAAVTHVRDCLPAGAVSSATLRLIARRSSVVLANSHYTARSVRAAAPGARLEVVHNPVDVRRFDPERVDRARARAALGAAGRSGVLLGVVAQLSPWKGQDTAVEATGLLAAAGADVHLLLIGSAKFTASATRFDNESYVAALKSRIAELGIGDRVSWLGEREDIPELMGALDILLLPSHEEPFGRALIEAMSLGVPVLATEVGGPGEIIRDGVQGRLLPPRDARAWADAVSELAAHPEIAREMGRAGRERVAEAFTPEHHAAAVFSVYERALQTLPA